MMRNIFILINCLLLHLTGYGQSFSVEGKLTGVTKPTRITLSFNGQTLTELSKDGTFKFKGESFPTDATLRVVLYHPTLDMEKDEGYWVEFMKDSGMWGVRDIFLDGQVVINGKTLNDAIVGGSKQQLVYEAYRTKFNRLTNALSELREEEHSDVSENDDDAEMIKKEAGPDEVRLKNEIRDLKFAFIKQYPDSYFSLELVNQEMGSESYVLGQMLNNLGSSLHNSERYKALKAMVDGAKKNNIGDQAVAFTLNDVNGNPLSLDVYKGKYVLIDFWASWCGPCRAENPNLLAVYNKFKNEKFDILGISLDKDEKAWVNAVKEDHLPWAQVIDRKGSEAVAFQYAIAAIPQNYLIGPDGKVLAKNLKSHELEETLARLFK